MTEIKKFSPTIQSLKNYLENIENAESDLNQVIALIKSFNEMGLDLDNPTTIFSKIQSTLLSSRTRNTLVSNDIIYVFQLTQYNEYELRRLDDFGDVASREVKLLLANLNVDPYDSWI